MELREYLNAGLRCIPSVDLFTRKPWKYGFLWLNCFDFKIQKEVNGCQNLLLIGCAVEGWSGTSLEDGAWVCKC